jgi:hypothetical protein
MSDPLLEAVRKNGVEQFVENLPPEEVELFIATLRRIEDEEK